MNILREYLMWTTVNSWYARIFVAFIGLCFCCHASRSRRLFVGRTFVVCNVRSHKAHDLQCSAYSLRALVTTNVNEECRCLREHVTGKRGDEVRLNKNGMRARFSCRCLCFIF